MFQLRTSQLECLLSAREVPSASTNYFLTPVECFTDVQCRDNKVCDSLFPVTLLIWPQVNVRKLFKAAFHLTKDEDNMLYDGALWEGVKSYTDGLGPSSDPLHCSGI
jgi:hypothetical protein